MTQIHCAGRITDHVNTCSLTHGRAASPTDLIISLNTDCPGYFICLRGTTFSKQHIMSACACVQILITTLQQYVNTDADSGHEGVLCAGRVKPQR